MIIFSSERFHRAAYRWLPFCWMILAGTQGLGMLRLLGINIGGESDSATAGSPVERILFMGMLALGLYLLARRSELLGRTFKANAPLLVLFCYIALSISWSHLPQVSLKRYIKMVGALTMAMLIATELNPAAALRSLLARYLRVVLIGSLFTILFVPSIGRAVNYDGSISNAGICFGKNGLGQCALAATLLAAIPIISDLRRGMVFENISMLSLALIILMLSHSSTSLVVCVVVLAILILIRAFATINVIHAGGIALFTVIMLVASFALAESLTPNFSIADYVIESLGKDSTLTGRTELWADVWKLSSERPVLGHGTGSFWVGDVGVSKPIMETYYWPPNQAHNGYLDVIGELGFVGLALVMCVAIYGLYTAFRTLPDNFQYAMLRIALIFSVLLLNITESSFCRITHRVWLFMLLATTIPPSQK